MHNIYQKGKVRIMNNLLIFFALPIATILLAIVLQKVLRSPILVGITFFAIYLIVTFAAFDANFLVVAIALTILAFITAVIVNTICRILERQEQCEGDNDNDNNNANCGCTRRSDLIAYTTPLIPNNTVILGTNTSNTDESNSCGCSRNNSANNTNNNSCGCCRCRRG